MKNPVLLILICFMAKQTHSQTFLKCYGGKNTEYGNSIAHANDDGFVVAGSSNNTGNKQIYLLKIDSAGNQLWDTYFGGKNFEDATSVRGTADGGYIICGITKSFKETYDGDVYLIKTDSLGKEQWSKLYGAEKMEIGNAVIQTTDGGLGTVSPTRYFCSWHLRNKEGSRR